MTEEAGKSTQAATELRPARVPVARALVAGALIASAYPHPGWWAASLIGYVPLIGWLLQERPGWRQAAAAGWIAGFVQHLWVYTFLGHTMREMSGFPWVASVAVIGLHAAAMGLHQAVWLGLCARLAPRTPLGQVVGFGLLLSVVEFALPWLFPWYLASALFRNPLWLQPADWIGVPLLSAFQVAFSVLVALAWQRRAWQFAVAAALFLGLWGGYGALRMAQLDALPGKNRVRVALVQHNPTLVEKRSRNGTERMRMYDRAESLTRALEPPPDLIVWAEGTLPFAWKPDLPAGAQVPTSELNQTRLAERVRKLVAAVQVPLLTGTLRHPDRTNTAQMRNAALLFRPNQPEPWIYDKKILLAFGEYLPGSELIPALRHAIPGISDFGRGQTSGLVEVAGAKWLVNICYEALFPSFLREEGAEEADVLLNLTNDVWFGPQPAPDLHLMVQQARAIELRRPLLRATTTGVSAYIDRAGRLVQETSVGQTAVLAAEVPLARPFSPYLLWGDVPMWALTLLMTWLALRPRRPGGAPDGLAGDAETGADGPQHMDTASAAPHNTRP